jgi:hypothetical protein
LTDAVRALTVAIAIEPIAPTRFDAQIANLEWARLRRGPAGVSLECASEDAERAKVLIARGGARVCASAAVIAPVRRALPALMSDLTPVTADGVIDTIVLRRVGPAEATARLERRLWVFRRPDRAGIRAVLRGDDQLFAWRRIVWATASMLRSRLRTARPVIFDRDAVEHGRERYAFARADELTRWLAG